MDRKRSAALALTLGVAIPALGGFGIAQAASGPEQAATTEDAGAAAPLADDTTSSAAAAVETSPVDVEVGGPADGTAAEAYGASPQGDEVGGLADGTEAEAYGAPAADDPFFAFYDAGYTYDDALALAALWDRGDDVGGVKAEASATIERGEELPLEPSGTPGGLPNVSTEEALDAYFGAGYDGNDAMAIRDAWNLDNTTSLSYVKGLSGEKLIAGTPLPVDPSGTPAPDEEAAVTAFFGAGYDYEDAVELAGIWDTATPYDAKVTGGEKVVAGYPLPIEP